MAWLARSRLTHNQRLTHSPITVIVVSQVWVWVDDSGCPHTPPLRVGILEMDRRCLAARARAEPSGRGSRIQSHQLPKFRVVMQAIEIRVPRSPIQVAISGSDGFLKRIERLRFSL
jgi:hypothetical protein